MLTVRQRFERAIKRHPDLVGYWPFKEVEGTTAINYAPATKGSHNGTIAGSLDLGQAGKIGRHFSNDANTSKRVTITHNATLATSVFSVMFLIRPTPNHESGGTNVAVIYTNFDGLPNGQGWYFRFNGTTSTTMQWGTYFNDAERQIDFTLTANVWSLCVATFDGTNLRAYTDGTLNTTLAGGTTYQPRTSGSIQCFSGFGGLNGDIQHLALFNDDLSQEEITEFARLAGAA